MRYLPLIILIMSCSCGPDISTEIGPDSGLDASQSFDTGARLCGYVNQPCCLGFSSPTPGQCLDGLQCVVEVHQDGNGGGGGGMGGPGGMCKRL